MSTSTGSSTPAGPATRAARRKLIPRVLHLAGRAPVPEFFEIDDAPPGS